MTSYRQGDILLVPFPFTDQTGVKQRPAVVLSSDQYNRNHPDVILAPITSQIFYTMDEIRLVDWKDAGLLKPSVIKPVLSSFEITLVRRSLGRLSDSDRARLRAAFVVILDLS
jgi:mRNA interferase MazF